MAGRPAGKPGRRTRLTRKAFDEMTGLEFERFLAVLFKRLGYRVEVTSASGDYGADLLLREPGSSGRLIAVQAKRLSANVGVSAVQEVYASMAHYGADAAWVVASGSFTAPARRLARENAVMLVDGTDLAELVKRADLRPRGGLAVPIALFSLAAAVMAMVVLKSGVPLPW